MDPTRQDGLPIGRTPGSWTDAPPKWHRALASAVEAQVRQNAVYRTGSVYTPGGPVAYDHWLLSDSCGLLWDIVAYCFGLLGVPGI